ncbi:MAG TPA: S1C family serine protease [Spirochaetia bacterium]|nr:S1C family serine protease [Spirochaetia bacterium]
MRIRRMRALGAVLGALLWAGTPGAGSLSAQDQAPAQDLRTGQGQKDAQDPDGILDSLVRVMATVPEGASTADSLGTVREGSGIVIDSTGLILTIGYLVVEADRIMVQTASGTVAADFVGYDGDTGFGLVRARSASGLKPMPLGESSALEEGDHLVVRSADGDAAQVQVISRGEFVSSWEYLLDSAVFTAPAFHDFGGAALILEGKLVGVGSVVTAFEVPGAGRLPANMFVPIDLLKPILQAMVRSGRSGLPAHPWLGVNTAETQQRVVVDSVTPGGPADKAGLKPGDIILDVGRTPVSGIADFYRRVWSVGAAGVSVNLRVLQGDAIRTLTVKSVDRSERLKLFPDMPGSAPAGPAVWLRP